MPMILTKVFGLILAVIAVQFVLTGIGDAVTEFLNSPGVAIHSD